MVLILATNLTKKWKISEYLHLYIIYLYTYYYVHSSAADFTLQLEVISTLADIVRSIDTFLKQNNLTLQISPKHDYDKCMKLKDITHIYHATCCICDF